MNQGLKYGYARVSKTEQNLNLQLDALQKAGCDRIFEDRISGKSRSRPGLDGLMKTLGDGDTIVVWRLDRLGRDFFHLVDVAEKLRAGGVNIVSITEGIDTASPIGQAVYRVLSVFADLERQNIIDRTNAGLAAARARGVVLGRRRKLTVDQVAHARSQKSRGHRADVLAHDFGVGRATLYRYVADQQPI